MQRTSATFRCVFALPALLAGEGLSVSPVRELVKDRPDFTESAETTPKGWLQWEGGFQFLERRGGTSEYAMGAPLLRFGLTERFEARLSTDGLLGQGVRGESAKRGMADAAIGFKYKFFEENRYRPALSVIPALALPTGYAGFSSGNPEPGVKLVWAKHVAGFDLSGNLNYNFLADDVGRFHQGVASLSVGHSITKKFSGYWEAYSFNQEDRASGRMTMFQGGLVAALGPNAQVDITGGRRLTSTGPDWMFAFGWVLRRPLSEMNWLYSFRSHNTANTQ